MNMKRKPVCALLLGLLVIVFPMIASAATDAAIAQEIHVTNTPIRGTIEIDKQGPVLTGFSEHEDAFGYTVHTLQFADGLLAGAVYEVRAAEDIVGKEQTVWFKAGELAATITTAADGLSATDPLPLGRYVVTEVSAPDGYVLDETCYEVVLSAADHDTELVRARLAVSNELMPARISLTKEKETVSVQQGEDGMCTSVLVNRPGEGFIFGLFTCDPIPYGTEILEADTLIATGITDEDGELTFSGEFPHGEYYVQELFAPEGWVLQNTRYRVSITGEFANEEHEVIYRVETPIHNEIVHADVRISKTDLTGSESLPGALIEVRNAEGEMVCRGYTGEDGTLPTFPAVPGTYTFREVWAPEGYALSEAEMTFTVHENGEVTGQTALTDEVTRFSIQKVDANRKPLAGVEFGLFREDGTLQASAVSDADGLATFKNIPYGTYTIAETQALPGYLKNPTQVPITLDGSFVNPEKPIATFENCQTEILIRKVDQDDVALAGATFGLFDEQGELVKTATSDPEGMVRFVGAAYGRYTIRELEAPEGYLLSKDVIHVTLDDGYTNSPTPLATVVNHQKKVSYIKVNTSGTPIPGVEFSLFKADTMEKVETAISDKNGVFTFSQFDYGDWIIRETAAPEGYCHMEDIRLHVGDDWTQPEPILCVNIPDHYAFLKTDSSGVPLPGVKFTVEDASGKSIGTYESNEDGIVSIRGLKPGEYFIKEIETLEGYSVSGEIIRLKIDEYYVVPDTLRRFINYTTIQTGVNLAVTGIMWVGIVLMAVSGTLGLIRKRRAAKGQKKD